MSIFSRYARRVRRVLPIYASTDVLWSRCLLYPRPQRLSASERVQFSGRAGSLESIDSRGLPIQSLIGGLK